MTRRYQYQICPPYRDESHFWLFMCRKVYPVILLCFFKGVFPAQVTGTFNSCLLRVVTEMYSRKKR